MKAIPQIWNSKNQIWKGTTWESKRVIALASGLQLIYKVLKYCDVQISVSSKCKQTNNGEGEKWTMVMTSWQSPMLRSPFIWPTWCPNLLDQAIEHHTHSPMRMHSSKIHSSWESYPPSNWYIYISNSLWMIHWMCHQAV